MTEADKVAVFEEELNGVVDRDIQTWLTACVEKFPDYFFEIGASSSGKHHPYWSQGTGGTVRHTKAVVQLAGNLVGTFAPNDWLAKSKVQAAALLHDSFKYGITYDNRIYALHPYIPRAVFDRVPYNFGEATREEIFRAIESHMGNGLDGSWSLLPYVTVRTIKESMCAHVVHMADYLASRESYVDPRFKDIHLPHVNYEVFDNSAYRGMIYTVLIRNYDEARVTRILSDTEQVNILINRLRSLQNKNDYLEVTKYIEGALEWFGNED